MAPTAAMALNGVGVAANVGQAVPLAFLISAILVFLVAFGIMRLAGHYSHAGSVYAFTGATLGPRAGFFSGWALLGTYLCFTVASTAEVGLFIAQFANGAGIWSGSEWIWIALAARSPSASSPTATSRSRPARCSPSRRISVHADLRPHDRHLREARHGHHARNQGFTADVFKLPGGTSARPRPRASCSAFLSLGGFEGAAALGEETNEPRREIPRAIRNAVIGAGIFYVLCMLAQSWGFGTDEAGVAAFAGSSSPLGDLGKTYIARGWAT